jgi:predicted permease
VKPAVLVFAAAAGLLLLITCINVANLLLVHGLGRVREIAVRSALGAGRGRIIAQLITESALLAVAGGVLGAVVGAVAVKGFVAFAPAGTPRIEEIHLDATAIGAAVTITAIVTLLFALAPALVTSRVELQDVLRAGSRQSGASRRFRVGTEALVVGQVALAVLVLSAAGIIARSFMKLERVDLAMEPARLFIAELAGPYDEFEDTRKLLALLDRLQPRVEAIPGVRAASLVLSPPFSGSGIDGKVEAEGQSADDAASNPILTIDAVTPSYFATFGIRVLRGRSFSEQDRDGSARVAIISESAARHYWPGGDPVGRRLTWDAGKEAVTVVGIVPDTRYRNLRAARSAIYFPLRQTAYPVAPMTLAIRFDGRLANLLPAVRRAVAEADPRVAVASASAFETLLQEPRAQPRLNALLLAVFAGAAVALAGVGLFGVMATTVRQRTKELGVRMALGATSNNLQGLVMRRGLTIAAVGSAMGLFGAVLGNRLLTAMLYEVSPTDGLTLTVVAGVLIVVAVLATIIPARATTRIDPVVALRAEG